MVNVENEPPAQDPILVRFAADVPKLVDAVSRTMALHQKPGQEVGAVHVVPGSSEEVAAQRGTYTFLLLGAAGFYGAQATDDGTGRLTDIKCQPLDEGTTTS